MKKILSLALLLSGIGFTALAQEGVKKNDHKGHDKKEILNKTAEEIAEFRTERLDKQLKLTDAQRKEVYALNLKEAKVKKEAAETHTKSESERLAAKKASLEQLNKILTPEQQKILAENKEKADSKKSALGEGDKSKTKKDAKRVIRY